MSRHMFILLNRLKNLYDFMSQHMFILLNRLKNLRSDKILLKSY